MADDDNPYKIQTPSAAKQFSIALFFGALAAFLTYQVADKLASPDTAVGSIQTQGAYKFVFYMAAFAGGLGFLVASKLYKWWADKQYLKTLGPPQAIARDRKDEKEAAPASAVERVVAAPAVAEAHASEPVEEMSATERALAQEDHLAQDDVSDRKRELEEP